MKRPSSLRTRLTIAVASVLGLSLSIFSLVLDTMFQSSLQEQFDARLAQDASAVASMIEYHGSGQWEFESGPLLGFEAGQELAYFEAWNDEERIIGRSPSLGDRDLPYGEVASRAETTILPGGRRGRVLRVELPPRTEPGVSVLDHDVTIVVARDTGELEAAIAQLRWPLWGSALTALGLATLAGAVAVHRGLAPVARLGARADAIDSLRLDDRLPVEEMPEELRPAVVKLNELLERLEQAFERERRFGADASHELRTPLAGLRSILEVARSRERPAADYRAAIDDALDVTRQLGALVESLLALARLDARHEPPARESFDLYELVRECYAPCADQSRRRRLRFENRVTPGETVSSDRDRLRIVIQNLVANAVEYTAELGTVIVACDPARGVLLEVKDSGPAIPEDALDKVFDRFFRLDPSRSSNGEHRGIGLSLARAHCETLGLALTASNDADGWTTFRLRAEVVPSSLRPPG